MSLGALDIALYEIDQSEQTLTAFADAPEAFLGALDLDLDEREMSALIEWDYARLYAMGAHPFLLFQAARSLAAHLDRPIPEFVAETLAAVKPLGTPDFIT